MGTDRMLALAKAAASLSVETPTGDFQTYCSGGHKEVAGWLEPGILTAITAISALQRAAGLPQTFAEIGIHHGRFYLALALASHPMARGVAIDIFERQDLNPDGSGRGNRDIFERHINRLGLDASRQSVIARDSRLVTASDVKNLLSGDAVSIFSVDGAHTVEYTMADLSLAANSLHALGVIIVDDLFNPRWPGVIDGVLQWLRSDGRGFEMFAYGDNKGFLAATFAAETYRDFFKSERGIRLGSFTNVKFNGLPCSFARFLDPVKAFSLDEKLERREFIAAELSFGEGMAGVELLAHGWSRPERGGVWSIAANAAIRMPLMFLKQAKSIVYDIELLVPSEQVQLFSVGVAGSALAMVEGQAGRQAVQIEVAELCQNADDASNQAGYLEFTFVVERCFVPKEFGIGSDARRLGMKLVKCRIVDRV